jgi:hypothetical protein
MEITKRFPQELGNLAAEREIPAFPQPIIFVSMRRKGGMNERYEVNHASHTKSLTLPLEISRTRDSHIPTADRRPGS